MADANSSQPDRHSGLLASITGHLYGYLKSHRRLDAVAVWISRRVRDAPPSSGLNFVLGPLRARFRGEMTGKAMLEVVDALESRGVVFWIAGGWGIDLLEGLRGAGWNSGTSTPGGMRNSMVRSRSMRPWPRQSGQRSRMICPAPWHAGHVRVIVKKPCW